MADDEVKCPECKEGAPEYMATYGDMMTLLLCFFVLLLSMAEVNPKKFDAAASSFQRALNGVLESMPTVAIHQEVLRPRLGGDAQNKHMAANVAAKMREVVQGENLQSSVTVEVTETGVAIKISDNEGFDKGKAVLKSSFMPVLSKMLKEIKQLPGRKIRVEGHTDSDPIKSTVYPSNWELSSARAISIVKYLHENGEDPTKMSGVGYGEFHPIADNDTEVNKRKNRRIEVYVDFIEPKDKDDKKSDKK